jgi:hypothetical protein
VAELGNACCGSLARKGKLALGWINSLDLGWRASFHEQFGEGAIAAAHVDPLQTRWRCQPIKKDAARTLAPIPHHPLICGPIVEADLSFSHAGEKARGENTLVDVCFWYKADITRTCADVCF